MISDLSEDSGFNQSPEMYLSALGLSAQGLSAQGLSAQGLSAPGLSTLGSSTPDLSTHDLSFHGLSVEGPFHSSNSIFQFYGGGGRGELLDQLSRHVQNCDEPVLVRGEPGSGKSMLCRVLAHRLRHKFTIACYIGQTISADLLLQQLLAQIWPLHEQSRLAQLAGKDEDASEPASSSVGFTELQQAVAEHSNDLKPILLMIDTPAELDAEIQEILDSLGTIQRAGFPVFRIVVLQTFPYDALTCQQDLEREWGVTTFTLRRLSLAEIHDYLQHHMLLFDFHKRNMFSREMSYFIADRSQGVVRSINTLARNAFLVAGIQDDSEVTMSHLLAAGLNQKETPEKFSVIQFVRQGGLKFALAVSSVVVLAVTWFMTSV